MGDIMLTSGFDFQGYEITEYLGFVNVQTALGSNFFKGMLKVKNSQENWSRLMN